MALDDPYITEPELSGYLKMQVKGNDDELARSCASASRWVERYCNRVFNLSDAEPRTFDVDPTSYGTVWLDDIGDAEIAVATDDALDGTYATIWDDSDFQTMPTSALDQNRPITSIRRAASRAFPSRQRRVALVKVTAKWGWPSIPDPVRQAALIQAARLYKRRDSAEGVLGFGDFGPVRVGARVDPDVEMLLAGYRRARFGIS